MDQANLIDVLSTSSPAIRKDEIIQAIEKIWGNFTGEIVITYPQISDITKSNEDIIITKEATPLNSILHTMSFLYPRERISIELEEAVSKNWPNYQNKNIITIGGPVVNKVTKAVLEKLVETDKGFTDPFVKISFAEIDSLNERGLLYPALSSEELKDKLTIHHNRTYNDNNRFKERKNLYVLRSPYSSPLSTSKANTYTTTDSIDFGFVMKHKNPFNPESFVFIIAGLDVYGTLASGSALCTWDTCYKISEYFAKHDALKGFASNSEFKLTCEISLVNPSSSNMQYNYKIKEPFTTAEEPVMDDVITVRDYVQQKIITSVDDNSKELKKYKELATEYEQYKELVLVQKIRLPLTYFYALPIYTFLGGAFIVAFITSQIINFIFLIVGCILGAAYSISKIFQWIKNNNISNC